MSTTSSLAGFKNNPPLQVVVPSSTISELRQKAYVDKSAMENYSIQGWVNLVYKSYEQGDTSVVDNFLESAYISYKRGCRIMDKIIKSHSQYSEIRFSPIYLQLEQRTNEEIFALLEELANKIENWYRMRQDQYYTNNTHFNINPVTPATTSAAAYAYRPSHDPRNFPHYSLNDLPTQNLPPSPSSSLAQTVSSKLTLTAPNNSQIQLPTWTNNVFANTLLVEPLELMKWITAKENPPSILLIDNRPREMFKRGCIKHLWIIQIEPVLWQKDGMAMKMYESILQSPETEQKLFAEKARFDLIVYYDQNSKSLDTAYGPTKNIRKILEAQHLRRPPMMLVGGFDAWYSTVGTYGIFTFPGQKEKRSWFKSSNSSTSSIGIDHEPHTLYDSFTAKPNRHSYNQQQQQHIIPPPHSYLNISIPQPSLPTAPRKESLTTRYPESVSPASEISFSSQRQPVSQTSHQQQDLRPMPPSYPNIHRRRTFIDNPFNGFTNTMSKLYDVPPMSIPHSGPSTVITNNSQPQRPSSAEPSVSINRPYAMSEFHHLSTNNIHSSPTTSSYSQSGTFVAIGTTGLKNLGNTCYMNSVIQCLSGTIPLARYFISGLFKQHINRNSKTGTQGVLAESFAELLRVMWSESYTFVSPMTFREALVRFAPRFSGSDQQDSQEFLLFLLDGLHEDLNSTAFKSHPSLVDDLAFEKLPDWQASALSWEKYLHRNSSVIVSLFQGQYRSRLTCLTCKQTSTTYNVFMSLSLTIPAKKFRISSITLHQCLDYFVKEETLDKEDAWKCPQCKKKRKALKQLTLTRLPDILLIHLKRFSMDGLFKNKLDIMVKCPTRSLDLSGYVPMTITPSPPQDRPSYVYDLYAVSNHYGSLSGGHYTACVRDGYTDKWHYFDDSRFSLCDENKVVTKAAYNLFYVRSKVK